MVTAAGELRFAVDPALLAAARAVLASRRLYWVLGGSCSGKSTICQAIAAGWDVPVIDMDAAIYGRFMPAYRPDRHPASCAWFHAPHPLAWIMALSPAAFDSLNRASNAEFLDLLAAELAEQPDVPMLVDGGFTHPSVLAQVVPPRQLLCLETTADVRVRTWETAAARAEMRGWIRALPEPDAMWQKFLRFDAQISDTLGAESRAAGIRILFRDEKTPITPLAAAAATYFGLT